MAISLSITTSPKFSPVLFLQLGFFISCCLSNCQPGALLIAIVLTHAGRWDRQTNRGAVHPLVLACMRWFDAGTYGAHTPLIFLYKNIGPVWPSSGSRHCSSEPFFSLLLSSLTDTTGAREARFSGSTAPAPVGTCRSLDGRHPATVQKPEPTGAQPNEAIVGSYFPNSSRSKTSDSSMSLHARDSKICG